MLNAIWRLLVYRLAGGRILLVLTVLGWLRGLIAGRRTAAERATAERAAAEDRSRQAR